MCPDRTGPVAGVVLAAGTSSRMGENKMMLELNGQPLLRRAVQSAIEAGLQPVIVVLGFEADLVRQALVGLSYREIENPEYESGINGSVRRGIAAVPPSAEGAVVMLADMPFVSADMLRQLVTTYRESNAPLVISRYGDVNAPPMLHDRSLFPEFHGPEGEGCGRHIVKRHRSEAAVLEWPEQALTDLDVPADYERVQSMMAPG